MGVRTPQILLLFLSLLNLSEYLISPPLSIAIETTMVPNTMVISLERLQRRDRYSDNNDASTCGDRYAYGCGASVAYSNCGSERVGYEYNYDSSKWGCDNNGGSRKCGYDANVGAGK